MITKKPNKKIKVEERGRWYPISDIKFYDNEPKPYQVLMKLGKGAENNELNKTI